MSKFNFAVIDEKKIEEVKSVLERDIGPVETVDGRPQELVVESDNATKVAETSRKIKEDLKINVFVRKGTDDKPEQNPSD